MHPDEEGFVYPKVYAQKCVDCGLCVNRCPILAPCNEIKAKKAFSGIIEDDTIRFSCSSGGLFWALASHFIQRNGVVFGAAFDDKWNVIHTEAHTFSQLALFKGSKYVQSSLNNIYPRVREYLQEGRNVLFSGTPCQIAGLRSFLNKDYQQLLLVDIACHGVPSPGLWQSYLLSLKKDLADEIIYVNFRDKKKGWKDYYLTIELSEYNHSLKEKKRVISERPINNVYMGLFRNNYSLRPSCYQCKFKSGKSGADITLCDFWGIPSSSRFNDDKGASSIIVFSEKGEKILSELCNVSLDSIDYNYLVKNNLGLVGSVPKPELREMFWLRFQALGIRGVKKYARPDMNEVRRLLINSFKNKIKAFIR